MRSQTLWNPRIVLLAPTDAGNTRSPIRGSESSTSQAACDRGRRDAPVFVSGNRAVRVTRSTTDQLSASISPRRQPVRARNLSCAYSDRPSCLGHRPEGVAQRGVFQVIDPSVALLVGVAGNATDRIVGPQPSTHREAKERAEHTHYAGCRSATAGDPRKPVLAGLDSRGRLALAHGVSKSLDVCRRHCRDLQFAQQRLDVPFDATPVAVQRVQSSLAAPLFLDGRRKHWRRVMTLPPKQPTSACGAPLWMKMVAARAGLSEPRDGRSC